MSALSTLRAAGLTASVRGDRLHVEPSAKLTDELRTYNREHKASLLAELTEPAAPSRLAKATSLTVTCLACRHFTAGEGPLGQCRRYDVETFPVAPFECRGYAPSALEQRRQKVEQQLRDAPSLRLAADVTDAPLRPEPGRPVSIVLAVRTVAGIVSGEFQAPRERFDTGVFLAYLKNLPEIPS